jgi:hypothetical protein
VAQWEAWKQGRAAYNQFLIGMVARHRALRDLHRRSRRGCRRFPPPGPGRSDRYRCWTELIARRARAMTELIFDGTARHVDLAPFAPRRLRPLDRSVSAEPSKAGARPSAILTLYRSAPPAEARTAASYALYAIRKLPQWRPCTMIGAATSFTVS